MAEATDIVVLGIGNLLCSDDGVGVHVIQHLQADPPAGAVLVDAGAAMLHALPFMEKARRVLVVDAMVGGGRPGTLYGVSLTDTALPDDRGSMHALNLRQAWTALMPDRLPPPIHVLGVEPENLSYGMMLSQTVADAMPRILELVRQWIVGGVAAMAQPPWLPQAKNMYSIV